MGFLLKEALKTLCGRSQWSYAVFWKIGCQNSKLLIWEECYYEPLSCPFPAHIAGIGTSNFSFEDGGSSQLGNQEGEGICSLVNKMMVNSSVNIVGEGIIGRAAFTGNHEWILLNNFTRDAYPPEVYNELHHQFSAGMQTVAVIPVLPHGVVQMGSFLTKMENIGLINEVKSLILQLGCIPGALLSEDYSAKASTETLGGPASVGVPVSVNPPIFTSKCTPFMANGSDQQSNSSLGSSSFVQPSHPLMGEINNHQSSVLLTHQSTNLTQPSSKYIDNFYQPKATAMMKPSFGGQLGNRVMEAEVVPANPNLGLQPHSVLYNARSAFNELTGFGQSGQSDYSRSFMEQQILSCIGNQDHVIPTTNASSALKMTQLKTNGGHIPDQSRGSVSTSLLGGVPTHGGMNGNLRPNLVSSSVSNPQRVATADFSGAHTAEIELRYDNLTEAGVYSLPDQASQSGVSPMTLEGPDQMNLPADLKRAHDVLAPPDQRTDDDLLHALKIPSLQLEDHVPLSGHIPGIVNDCLNSAVVNHSSRKIDAKPEELCAQPSSGEDLFDVLGVDFKNKLLNENWNTFFADELDANAENLDKAARVDVQGIDPDCCSINETISDSGVFSGRCTDHLLDAVVSKAQSVVKQDSDDVSCRTTLTRISNTSVPSPSFRQPMSDHVPGRLFDCPKTLGKNGAAEASSLRSGCSKDDAGNFSQTTSIYGSQLSSWVENASNIKRESSVSTGYSKRPDEVAKSTNRKRLKPGENPRPRPKDRQMIQDRVKELRDIVPNGAKCSIDALLERTIKHMLFLQSVTKHADKLKQTGESKIVSKEGGLLLKDNFEGGATWAYEVGSQSMVCPIIVEDLNPPRQMLVEMLCEERGFFLEIADLIRGMGLTILKGVMEARNDKIWARFAVEANRDVTRMEIFMSLVHLLEQTGKGGASSSNPIDNNMMAYHAFPQAAQIPATGMPSSL